MVITMKNAKRIKSYLPKLAVFLSLFILVSCAQLHHVQIGEIASHPDYIQKPFEIKISEMGVNIDEAAKIVTLASGKSANSDAQEIAGLIGLFQMGPRTGEPVYEKDYAKNLIQVLYEKCPSGKISGLTSIRETRKYPVISGEIVKITGYCLMKKGSS